MQFSPLPKPAKKIIVVANEKGGVGKTTIATNMAYTCAAVGWDVLLIDVDPQASSTKWANARQDYDMQPSIACMGRSGKCGQDIAVLAEKFDVVVVDSGGRDSIEMRHAMGVADVVLMPVSAGQFEVWSVATMDTIMGDVLARVDRPIEGIAFLTRAAPNLDSPLNLATYDQLKPLENYRVLPAEKSIVNRVAYQYAAVTGRSVFEKLDRRDVKAEEEVKNLFEETFGVTLEVNE